jgi:protein-tyrosine phosphatase
MPVNLRFPQLVGALNFRDMGGYPAQGGRHTRWDTLFRSGSTHEFTAEDLRQRAVIGIRYAYDFRSNSERADQPSGIAALKTIQYRHLDHDHLPGNVSKTLVQAGVRSEDTTAVMISMYRRLPLEFRTAFKALFQHLASGDLPMVFSCTAGKDRTGVAAALVLSALGVPREIVLEDYLVTELFFERSCKVVFSGHLGKLFEGIDRQVWEPVMRARPEYLNAAFDQIALSWGSLDNYLQQELDVSAADLELIRNNLLEVGGANVRVES